MGVVDVYVKFPDGTPVQDALVVGSFFCTTGETLKITEGKTDSSGHVQLSMWGLPLFWCGTSCVIIKVFYGNTFVKSQPLLTDIWCNVRGQTFIIGGGGGQPGVLTLQADDGLGHVGPAIVVADQQKFWFKGFAIQPNDRIDVWFDEYGPDPPYPYIHSHWLATVYSNSQLYFDTYPNDLCWLKNTGRKDGKGRTLWELWQSKGGLIWTGPIETNLGFRAIEAEQSSEYATVKPTEAVKPTIQSLIPMGVGLAVGLALIAGSAGAKE